MGRWTTAALGSEPAVEPDDPPARATDAGTPPRGIMIPQITSMILGTRLTSSTKLTAEEKAEIDLEKKLRGPNLICADGTCRRFSEASLTAPCYPTPVAPRDGDATTYQGSQDGEDLAANDVAWAKPGTASILAREAGRPVD